MAGLRDGRHTAAAVLSQSGERLKKLGASSLSMHTMHERASLANAAEADAEELLELRRKPAPREMFALPPAIQAGRLQWSRQRPRTSAATSPAHMSSDGSLGGGPPPRGLEEQTSQASNAGGGAGGGGGGGDSSAAEMSHQAVKGADHTWQYVSRVHPPYERPSMRSDILALESRFTAAMERVDNPDDMAGQHSALDRDLMGIQGHVDSMLGSLANSNIAQHKEGLGLAIFEQKWTDLVLGEMGDQLMVSCLEQGRLLRKIRLRYAGVFARMVDLHRICLQSLDESVKCVEAERAELDTLREAQDHTRELLHAEHMQEIQELERRMQDDCDEYRVKAETAADQVEKMSETLKTLNGIFHTIQNDTDAMQAADLRHAYAQLESVVAQRDQEIARLRKVEREHEANALQLSRSATIIEELKTELAATNTALEQKEDMVQDLLRREGERLNELEMTLAQARDAEAEREEALVVERQRAQQAANQQMQTGSLLCVKCNQSLDALSALDADKEEAARKRRLQCENYRLLLPNLAGERPERSNQWTLACARAMLHSKQLADSLCVRENRNRVRMPEFVYGFFEPTALALAEASRDAREQMVTEADNNRWGFYYGLKALARECVEAKLLFNMLDEKHGEDELVFSLNAIRVLMGVAGETVRWGPGMVRAESYFGERDAFDAIKRKSFTEMPELPNIVWADMRYVGAATEVILAKATTDEQMALLRKVSEHASPSTDRLADEYAVHPDGKTGTCVDAFMWLRILLHEYREEQAHRRAALRLMFNTAATGALTDVVVPNSRKAAAAAAGEEDDEGAVDLPQFAAMIYTLNQEATVFDVVRLYREAFHEGGGTVNYKSFTAVAERDQFFSACLRLPPFLGAAHLTELNHIERTGLGSIIHLRYSIFSEHLDAIATKLPARAQAQLRTLRKNVDIALHEGVRGLGIDGRRPLCAYRRMLWLLLYLRMVSREDTGELGLRDPVDAASREISALETIVLDCVPLKAETQLRRARAGASVVRIQRAWRARLARDVGVPLSMRGLLHSNYGNGKSGMRNRYCTMATSTLLCTLGAIYVAKLVSDDTERRNQRPPTPLLTFLYDFYLTRYGQRELAERHLHDLFVNVRNGSDSHPRIKLFAVFTGVLRQVAHPHSASTAGVEFFMRLLTSVSQASQSLAGGAQNEALVILPSARTDQAPKDGLSWCHSDALVRSTRAALPKLAQNDMATLIQRVQALEDPKAAGLVNTDAYLMLMMEEFNREIGRTTSPLRVAFGERTHNGIASFDGVVEAVHDVLPDLSEIQVSQIVGAALRMAPPTITAASRHDLPAEELRSLPRIQALLQSVSRRVAWTLVPKAAGRQPQVLQHPAQAAMLLHTTWRSYEVQFKTLIRVLEAQVQQLREDEEDGLLDADEDEEAARPLIKAHHVDGVQQAMASFEQVFEDAQVGASALRLTIPKAVEASKLVARGWGGFRSTMGELAVAMKLANRSAEPIRDNFEKQRGGS